MRLAVAKLPKGYRQVFVLHDVLGCEHNEIAEILGYSIGNSESQLRKARLRLRKLLGTRSRRGARRAKDASTAGFAQSINDLPPTCNGRPLQHQLSRPPSA